MKILDVPKSGKCGQVVAFESRYGLCLRQLVQPRNTITAARQHMRAVFGSSAQMWGRKLTQQQRDRWNAAGSQVMSHPRLSQGGPLTGQQFWQAISSVRGRVGLPPVMEPPAPVVFGRSVVGRLVITNGEEGVRLWLAVSGEPDTDIMVFGQEPCSAGRTKRRNVSYLGLLPPPVGGLSEITHLYRAKYGEPRPGRKVFIVTCQQKDGWKGMDQETSEIVPDRPEGQPGPSAAENSQKPLMYKGCTRGAEGKATPAVRPCPEGAEAETRGGEGAAAALGSAGAAGGEAGASG
jgi:hypothetical protein